MYLAGYLMRHTGYITEGGKLQIHTNISILFLQQNEPRPWPEYIQSCKGQIQKESKLILMFLHKIQK